MLLSLMCHSDALNVSSGCVEMVRSQSSRAMWKPIRSVGPQTTKYACLLTVFEITELDCQQYQGQTMISANVLLSLHIL